MYVVIQVICFKYLKKKNLTTTTTFWDGPCNSDQIHLPADYLRQILLKIQLNHSFSIPIQYLTTNSTKVYFIRSEKYQFQLSYNTLQQNT